MKRLRNKETGQVFETIQPVLGGDGMSIAELNEKWEDVPDEPKKYWFIDAFGNIVQNKITKHSGDAYTDMSSDYESQKRIGNRFETKEEAEKALKRLKAFTRLEDKGFRFFGEIRYESLCGNGFNVLLKAEMPPEAYTDVEVRKDLALLFSEGDG